MQKETVSGHQDVQRNVLRCSRGDSYWVAESELWKAQSGASLGNGHWTFRGSERAEARASLAHRVWTPCSSSWP